MIPIYLDNNATTRIAPEVLDTMIPYLTDRYGNPSSVHRVGDRATAALADARDQAAAFLKCRASEIVFTSGGTESNNAAIRGVLESARDKRHIVTSSVEHASVLEPCRQLEQSGYRGTYIGVDRSGALDLAALERALTDDTAIVSIMAANNETGVVFPIDEIARIVKSRGVPLHVDAVQAAGKIPLDMEKTPADLLTLSGHKLHAPKGVGLLYIRHGTRAVPLIVGGGQEKGRRSGTPNVPGIVGFGKALELAEAQLAGTRTASANETVRRLRDKLERGILERIPKSERNGAAEPRLPNTTNIAFDGVEGESVLISLDEAGVCASSGSACSTGAIEPSHVLKAMGVPGPLAMGSLRFSLSRYTTDEEIDRVLEILPSIVERLRGLTRKEN